jgi:hypothetical protein
MIVLETRTVNTYYGPIFKELRVYHENDPSKMYWAIKSETDLVGADTLFPFESEEVARLSFSM